MSKSGSKRLSIIITVPAAVMLLALYSMIFGFSAQDGEASGSLSHQVSEKCVDFYNDIAGKGWSNTAKEYWVDFVEHPIRKLAHFSEYALLGFLVFVILMQWNKKRSKYLWAVIWIFLSACGDEIHQYYVPGRYASFSDVLLDTTGGVVGVACCVVLSVILSGLVKRFCNKNKIHQILT